MSEISTHTQVGSELFTTTRTIDRASLVRYAGASGDFNPIHWNERIAREVGLDGVIAHGMLTMGLAGAALTDWLGSPSDLLDYQVRFSRPIPVPDPGSVDVSISAKVGTIDAEVGTARVDLTVVAHGAKVLAKSRATVRIA